MRVIINCIMDDKTCDTSMVTYHDMWRMALDIAKKREGYAPHKKQKKSKKAKLKTFNIAAVAATAAAAATTAINLADDPEGEEDARADEADADEADADDGELVEIDRKAQEMRSNLKNQLSKKKEGDVKRKKQPDKKKKHTAKKKKRTPKKTEEETEDGEEHTPPKKKRTTKKTDEETEDGEDDVLTVGMRVMGKWYAEHDHDEGHGDWFYGTVASVDKKNKTIHIKYDDGDEDPKLSWNDVSIVD